MANKILLRLRWKKSAKLNIKLTAVARASLGELLEDYRDFLRINNLAAWYKDDPRAMIIRRIKIEPYKSYKACATYMHYLKQPETFASLMLTLIATENYMLDKMINTLEQNFIRQGGYTENLATKRRNYRDF